MKEGSAYLHLVRGGAERERPGVEAEKLGCLEGRGSPQESVKQGVSVKGEKGTIPAITDGWRVLEARPGRAPPPAS